MTTPPAPATAYRYATSADVPAIRVLVERAYRGMEAAQSWSNEAHLLAGSRTSEAEVARLVGDPDCRFVLAEVDGRLLGCALIHRLTPPRAYFGMFAVEPTLQSAGFGKALLAQLEASVTALWGATVMTLSVINLRAELIAYYARRGYVLTGRREPFPFDATTGELRRDFELVEMEKPL